MTQKQFDVEGKDIWDIFPEKTYKIVRGKHETFLFDKNGECFATAPHYLIKINWHDKTEITRPVNYEDMIGCVGWFGGKRNKTTLSILKSVDCTYGNPWFECKDGKHWDDFTPAKKSELKFYGEDK